MRNDVALRWSVFGLVALVGLVGCSGEDQVAPSFPEGSGQPAAGAPDYPAGPYGIGVGSVVANYQFVGFANAMENSGGMQAIQLADFYNPTGTDLFPEGSPYGSGTPKPKALLIDVSSVWCGPCNYEADQVLPGLYAQYQPQGGEFLLQLADGPTPGTAAEPKHLYNWTQKYDVDYPATIDPTYKLGALFEADAFPANMIIKTQDMTIVEVLSGAPEPGDSFWTTFEKVMSGQL
jgi:hypothetical protein